MAAMLVLTAAALGQEEAEPVLRLEAGGPTSYVTSLAFSPDGQTLYAGSWDKTVYVWRWDERMKEFQLDPLATLRVPIGPGLDGAVNAIAVSADGNWLAAAGTSPVRGAADFRRPGQVIPTLGGMTSDMRQDAGTIYVFNTRNGQASSLRGHRGEVRALTFAPSDAERPTLVSAAREWNENAARHEGVVRVWQGLSAEVPPVQRVLPVPGGEEAIWATWPKLAARRSGEAANAMEVAIAWGDGVFRVWDVAANRVAEAPGVERILDVVTARTAAGPFVSGAFGDDESMRLRTWQPAAGESLSVDAANSVELPRSREYRIIPRGVAFASSATGKQADVMCAVVHRNVVNNAATDQYELWLYQSPFRGGQPRMTALWPTGPPPRRAPQLATSASGEHLAVSREGEIHVYRVAELVAGRAQAKILRNSGAAIEEVAFVRRRTAGGTALGLRLSESRPAATGGRAANAAQLVFDFERGTLRAAAAADGWTVAAPAANGWRADVQALANPAGARQLAIAQNGQRRGVITLNGNGDRARFVLASNAQPPLVALATYDAGIPSLGIYDAATGQQLRQLTAHSALIRSVAFSDDGQLLASTADDETVCVWQLADLAKISGQRGKAPGLTVRPSRAGLVVVERGANASGDLRDGDLIVGRVNAEGVAPFNTAREFYDAFWNARPGETVRVRRRTATGEQSDVALPVVQGIDERKPLFSLFVAKNAAGQPRDWIGWSPLGPYQSSAANIERHLGWHFNTGRPEAPVAFAQAGQYRNKYFREGLIDALIKTGQPPEEKRAGVPLPRPILDLLVEGSEGLPVGGDADLLVRRAPEKASLLVVDLDPEQVGKIDLMIDGQVVGELHRQPDGTTWSAALDPTSWKPGDYRLKAVVHTREETPQQFDVQRRVRYQAPAPLVTLAGDQGGVSGLVVNQGTLPITATIEPGSDGQPTDVTLVRKDSRGAETIVKQWSIRERLEIKENIELGEGGNQLELVARNRDALAGQEPRETERKRLTVNYQRTTAPPVIASAKVEPIGGGQAAEPLAVGHEARVVTVSRVRFSGEIAGTKEDLVVESSLGSASAPLRIAPAVADKPATFSSDEIELKPGRQTLLVRRKADMGPAVATTIELDYRPPLPEIVIEQPQAEQTLVAGRDAAQLDIVAKLQGLPPDATFQATILVNGEPAGVSPTIDRAARTLAAKIPLASPENIIEIKSWDTWNEPRITRVGLVRYLNLPSIEKIAAKNEQRPVIELSLAGKSASPITRLELGSDVLPASAIGYDAATGAWTATAQVARKQVPFEVAVQVRNRDGLALSPGKFQVPAWKQVDPPPSIELPGSGNVTAANYELRFTIRSRSQPRSINVKHNRQPVDYAPELASLRPDASGWYVFSGTLPVELDSGNNRFDVVAANDGGAEAQQATINYIDPPARIVIDRVESLDPAQKVELPVIIKDRRARVAGISPTGKVLVKGRVNWPLSTDKSYLAKQQRLQLWVNGFQQAPGVLQQPKPGSPTSEFAAFAVLNEKEGNRIQLALPDLTSDIATLFDFEVDCAQPVREQRLHILIVGVGSPRGSEPELEDRVLKALQASRLREKVWRSAAFDQIAAYGPIVGNDITPQQVRSQLSIIKLKIDELYQRNRTGSRPANDVVMIYLQGGALINAGESFFVTTRPAEDPRMIRAVSQLDPRILMDVSVQSRTLANFLTHTTGAHVLMLDVTGNLATSESAQWPADSRAAMLRYTWLKGTNTPNQARLLAALPEALERSSSLAQLDQQMAEYNRSLASQFPGSTAYNRRVPPVLENLLLISKTP